MNYYDVDETLKPLISRLAVGNDDTLRDQLIAKSRQPNILKYTPNDAAKRFGSIEMFNTWLSKGRELHWLLGPNDDLAGVIWYGQAVFPLPDLNLPEIPQETFAIRLYAGYAGQGLARPFMNLSLKVHVQENTYDSNSLTGIWLQTDIDNAPALSAYAKFGYNEVARDDQRVTMVLTRTQILRIVT